MDVEPIDSRINTSMGGMICINVLNVGPFISLEIFGRTSDGSESSILHQGGRDREEARPLGVVSGIQDRWSESHTEE